MAASTEGVTAPETPPKTSKKAAKENHAEAGNAGSKKRQSLIDELLHKTRRSAVSKTGKAASKKSGLSAGEQPHQRTSACYTLSRRNNSSSLSPVLLLSYAVCSAQAMFTARCRSLPLELLLTLSSNAV